MLSNQSEKKVHSLLNALSSGDLTEIKPTLISIKEAFEISEEDSGKLAIIIIWHGCFFFVECASHYTQK